MYRTSNYYLRRAASGPMVFAPEGGEGGAGGTTGAPAGDAAPPPEAGGGGEGDGPDPEAIKDPEKKRLAEEAARYRKEKSANEKRALAAEARVKELEDKDKDELERTKGDLEAATTVKAQLAQANNNLRIENAFLKAAGKYGFIDLDAALILVDRKKLTIEDGEVKGMKDALEKLARDKPYLIGTAELVRQPSGGPFNQRTGPAKATDEQVLRTRFPAIN